MNSKRLIEEALPIKEISREAAKEKNVKKKHIATLHPWWARKPLVACRGGLLGALIESPSEHKKQIEILKMLKEFCRLELSRDANLNRAAQDLIYDNHNNEPPKILDAFAGSGAIPFEALRLGCEVYAVELNPVAYLIELCTIVYPFKYNEIIGLNVTSGQNSPRQEATIEINTKLARDVYNWGKWIYSEAKKELDGLYPQINKTNVPLAYFWARTAVCQNPKCKAVVPLITQLWLSDPRHERVALKLIVNQTRKKIKFEIAREGEIDFNPKSGTMKSGSLVCPLCLTVTKNLQEQARSGSFGEIMLAVISSSPSGKRQYDIASENDKRVFDNAASTLENFSGTKLQENLTLIPNEPLIAPGSVMSSGPNPVSAFLYGFKTWGDLYNSRQNLAISTFIRKIREAYSKIRTETKDDEYAKAIVTYLGLCLDGIAHHMTNLSMWYGGSMGSIFIQGTSIPMRWNYGEMNPFTQIGGSWNYNLTNVVEVIEVCSKIKSKPAIVEQGSATQLSFKDKYFDAIITDPPYYNAIPYSDLANFFYVLLRRTVGHHYPEAFGTPLSPNRLEVVQNPMRTNKDKDKAYQLYKKLLTEALDKCQKTLKDSGIAVIIFAHKSTAAWEALLQSLVAAGFIITASWPVHTERTSRQQGYGRSVLASSTFLICRKREANSTGSWKAVQDQVEKIIKNKLELFLSEGIKGADAFISCIGPAMQVFANYNRVEKITGEQVTIEQFLQKVREIVSKTALAKVLEGKEMGVIDPITSFYVVWRWMYEGRENDSNTVPISSGRSEDEKKARSTAKSQKGNGTKIPFDEAKKLAQALGAETEEMMESDGILSKDGEYMKLLGPESRKTIKRLGESIPGAKPPSIIDILHKAALLWEKQESSKLQEFMQITGATTNDVFWSVAQALSNILPLDSKEKQLIDGLLGKQDSLRGTKVKSVKNKPLLEYYMEEDS